MSDDNEFDIEAAVDTISEGLGFEPEVREDEVVEEETEQPEEIEAVADSVTDEPVEQPEEAAKPEITDDYPKSFPKELRETWVKMPPEIRKTVSEQIKTREKQMLDGLEQYKSDAQYGKSFKEVITPYKKVIDESGVTETQAIQHLMNAHVRLTYGSKESRLAAYQELGRTLGLEIAPQKPGETPSVVSSDPELAQMKQVVSQLQAETAAQKQAAERAIQEKTQSEVDKFANDNPYFDEVAEDVAIYIKGGLQLKEAYERAVWANPVTRLKEQARLQTEQSAALKKKAEVEAKKAKSTKSSNINNRHTKSVPTAPKGKMFDDMDDILSDIRNRQH